MHFCLRMIKQAEQLKTVAHKCVPSGVCWSVMRMSHQGLSFLESSSRLLPEKMNENEINWYRVDLRLIQIRHSRLYFIFGCFNEFN